MMEKVDDAIGQAVMYELFHSFIIIVVTMSGKIPVPEDTSPG